MISPAIGRRLSRRLGGTSHHTSHQPAKYRRTHTVERKLGQCRSIRASLKRNGLGQIKDAVSISERPACVEDRAVPGHWEGDLVGGSKNSYVATLVERHSRYVMLVKVANKDTESVVTALIKQSKKLPGDSISP